MTLKSRWRENIYSLLINQIWMKSWEDDSISRESPDPFLKGSTISMLPYYRVCTISWERNEQLIFYDPEKKNQARKRQKDKERKNPWSKNEPTYTLLKQIVKIKGKRTFRTFEGDFPLLVCGFTWTWLPWTKRKKAWDKLTLKKAWEDGNRPRTDIGPGFKFP